MREFNEKMKRKRETIQMDVLRRAMRKTRSDDVELKQQITDELKRNKNTNYRKKKQINNLIRPCSKNDDCQKKVSHWIPQEHGKKRSSKMNVDRKKI